MTLGKRVIVAIAFLLLARTDESGPSQGDSTDQRRDAVQRAGSSAPSLTVAEMEERVEKLAERREKLDYFYITAFTAILVFTFNNFNSRSGVLVKAPILLVEVGWGSLIAAALCPLYVISARFKRFAINLDEIAGKTVNQKLFHALRVRGEFAYRAMTLLFVIGVGALCAAYALGLSRIKT